MAPDGDHVPTPDAEVIRNKHEATARKSTRRACARYPRNARSVHFPSFCSGLSGGSRRGHLRQLRRTRAPEPRVDRRAVTRDGLIKPGWPGERHCPFGPERVTYVNIPGRTGGPQDGKRVRGPRLGPRRPFMTLLTPATGRLIGHTRLAGSPCSAENRFSDGAGPRHSMFAGTSHCEIGQQTDPYPPFHPRGMRSSTQWDNSGRLVLM